MNKKLLWLIFPALALALALPFVTRRLSNQQEKIGVAPKAATPTGTTTFTFSPASTAVLANQSLPVNVMLFAPLSGDANGIIGAKAVLTISPASAVQLTSTNIQTPLASPWSYVRKDVTTASNVTTVTIEAVYVASGTVGYTGASATPQVLATLSMTATAPTTTTVVNLAFNTTLSEVRGKTSNQDILSSNLSPGNYTVYVDTAAPDTQISGAPPTLIRNNSITFTFSGSDSPPPAPLTPGALDFSYRLDTGAYSAFSASTSATLTNLSVGSHTFSVRARDAAGNIDSTPATFTFTYTPDTQVSLQFKLPGKPTGGIHNPQNIILTVRNGSFNSGQMAVVATYSSTTTNYSVPATIISNFPATGSYDILVSVPGYLNKLLTGNTITLGQTNNLTRTATADQPVWGDVSKDNSIQLSDITAAIAVWTSSDTPVATATQIFDLDENGFISLSDITAIISNWTSSVVGGDI